MTQTTHIRVIEIYLLHRLVIKAIQFGNRPFQVIIISRFFKVFLLFYYFYYLLVLLSNSINEITWYYVQEQPFAFFLGKNFPELRIVATN